MKHFIRIAILLMFFSGNMIHTIQLNASASNKMNINLFGAKGDGETLNTQAINQAIEACAEQGGGTVIIPKGTFISGTILLKSHVSLFLEKGSILKGSPDLNQYKPYIPAKEKEMEKYDNAGKYNWNKALILGAGISDVTISGEGTIDGDHVFNPEGEENMRGPHTIVFGECRNLTISGITIRKAANYGLMAYEIENVTFQNLAFSEGWDGIHIRGGKNMIIRNCEFYTGDDAIAGGYWENMVITDCSINSSCNGIRMIMPATNLEISHCLFTGPGKYPHRTSKDLKRNNMLTAILLQPGGWGKAPGRMEHVYIHDITMENLDTPFMFVLNEENEGDHILVEHVKASHINKSASSIESWKGGYFGDVTFRDVLIEYVGHNDPALQKITTGQPHVDSRILPCWGWFVRNVKQLTFENVQLKYIGTEVRPACYFEQVEHITFENSGCQEVPDIPVMVADQTIKITGKLIVIPKEN